MFRFSTTEIYTKDGRGTFGVRSVDLDIPADQVQGAYDDVQRSLPAGHRIWTICEITNPEAPPRCFACGGPFSISTGSLLGHQRTPFCGTCMADTADWFRRHRARRCRGPNRTFARFYDHAGLPPGTPHP